MRQIYVSDDFSDASFDKRRAWVDLTDVKIRSPFHKSKCGNSGGEKRAAVHGSIDHRARRICPRLSVSKQCENTRANTRNGNATRMDEVAITPEPIRKRARIGSDKCDARTADPATGITSLPVEIIYEIFAYLPCKDLYAIGLVSTLFHRLAYDPFLWPTYEVTNNKQDTDTVIRELKRMSLLKKFYISFRADCDDILRQLSLSNKRLEELHISNCTGSTSKLYLRSVHLIRILERCRNLHTLNILGSRVRGQKIYRLLADKGPRLRSVYAPATRTQFCTFIKHVTRISETDRETICSMNVRARKSGWSPLYYFVTRRPDHVCTALISYLHNDILLIDANRPIHKLSITERRAT